MAGRASGRGRAAVVWALRVVLGVVFLYIGATKLTGTGNTVEYFAAIGWGQWFRYVTGAVDVAGVVLLFVPRRTRVGAALLACSVGLGTLISVTVLRGDPKWGSGRPEMMVAVPLVLTLLAVGLAWVARPSLESYLERARGTGGAAVD